MSDGDGVAIGLIALFATVLVTAQLTASKVIAVSLPVTIPKVGASLVFPGAVLAYALTFFATDCYAELYGRRPAQLLVNIGFVMNFVMLALVWSTILAPAAEGSVPPGQFRTVLGASTNIVAGSLLAYLVSQNWDVFVFDKLRELTDGRHLWLRNVLSTSTSQAIDTAIFGTIAFYGAPVFLGIGQPLARPVLIQLLLGQYLFKVGVALLDTPFVYAVVALARRRGGAGGSIYTGAAD